MCKVQEDNDKTPQHFPEKNVEGVASTTTWQLHEELLEENMKNMGTGIKQENLYGIFVVVALVGLNTCQDADMV